MTPPKTKLAVEPEDAARQFGKTSEAVAAGVFLLYALPIVILFFILWIERRQRARCPDETFLFGYAPSFSRIALEIWIGVPLALLAVAFAAGLGFRIVTGRRVGQAPPATARFVKRGLLLLLLLMIAGTATASRAQYCLSPRGILLREQPWTELRFHEWRDIARIDTWCARTGRSFEAPYVLTLWSGEALDIAAAPRAFVRAFPRLAEQLHDMPFQFRRGTFAPHCTVPQLAVMQARP